MEANAAAAAADDDDDDNDDEFQSEDLDFFPEQHFQLSGKGMSLLFRR